MEKNVAIILSMTVAAITVTFLATNGVLTATPFAIAQIPTLQSVDSKVLGHVTYVLRGPDGHIKSYMQTDNIRTTQGLNCATNYLFNNKTTATGCPATTGTTGFSYVALLNKTGFATSAADTLTTLSKQSALMNVTGEGGSGANAASGLFGAAQSVTLNGATGQAVIVSPAYTFSKLNTGTTATTVTGSALFNAAGSTANEFAENTMSVAVGNQDTLTVTWTINLT